MSTWLSENPSFRGMIRDCCLRAAVIFVLLHLPHRVAARCSETSSETRPAFYPCFALHKVLSVNPENVSQPASSLSLYPSLRCFCSIACSDFCQLKKGPDLEADGFSPRTAFFCAHLSSSMHSNASVVQELFHNIGLNNFKLFTVSCSKGAFCEGESPPAVML